MKVLTCSGASITDICFTLDARIMGHEITWNVTRMQRDAVQGLYGPPAKVPVANLPKPSAEDNANIEWDKVDRMIRDPHVLRMPALAIGRPEGDGVWVFVDGNHRIAAHMKRESAFFRCYIVPYWAEKHYRVTFSQPIEQFLR